MPSLAPGEEQHQAPIHNVGQLAKNQLCRESSGSTGEQTDHEPAMCPCSKAQEHPVMHSADYRQQVEGSKPFSLLSPDETHLECRVHSVFPSPCFDHEGWTESSAEVLANLSHSVILQYCFFVYVVFSTSMHAQIILLHRLTGS